MSDFVDDKSYYLNLIQQVITTLLQETMGKLITIWDELLTFTRRKLELCKCGFYIIDQEFDSNERPIKIKFDDLINNKKM